MLSRVLVVDDSPVDRRLAGRLIENALEDCVSAFDGFGREIFRIHAKKSSDPAKAEKVSFQNLDGANQNVFGLFSFELNAGLSSGEWNTAIRGFQKRHLLSHKMGVVDADYLRKSGDTHAVVGRKIDIGAGEVQELALLVGKLAQHLSDMLQKLEKKS